jgi:aminopeptidase N
MVVNAGGFGVFRTTYGESEMAAIASALDRLDELERAVLFADTWAALFAGETSWQNFLQLARGLGDFDEPASWNVISHAFEFASRVATEDDQRSRLAAQASEIFGPQLARLGWDHRDGEDELAVQVRSIVIGSLGTVGHDEAVRAEALRRFDANEVDGDLARSVLRIVSTVDRPGDYERVLDRFHSATNPQEQQRYLWALADFTDEEHAMDAAERCFSEFRTQDAPTVLGLLTRNPVTGQSIWRYVAGRWDEAMAKFPANGRSRVCSGIPFMITDREFAAEVAAFHRSHPIAGEERSIEQLIEKMEIGLDFADAIRPQL